MSNAPGVETQAPNIFDRRFFVHSDELIATQDFDDPHTLDGRFFRGPFSNEPMVFTFENQDENNSLTIEILASFDYDNRDRQLGITGGNREVTETDATTTWDSISTNVIVPKGRAIRIVDWPALSNARSPDALRFCITVGTGVMLVDARQGYI